MAIRFTLSIILFLLIASLMPLGVNQSGISNDNLDIHQIKYSNNQTFTPVWNTSTNGSATLAISSDGTYAVVGSGGYWNSTTYASEGGTVSLYHYQNQTPMWTFEVGDQTTGVDISDSGEYIVAATHGGNLHVWNQSSNVPIWTYSNNGSRLSSTSISNDGGSIVVSDWITEEIIFFENFSSTPKWRIPTSDFGVSITRSLISPNGDYIVVYDEDFLELYSNTSTVPIWEFPYANSSGNQPFGVEISEDQSTMVIGTFNGTPWTGPGDTTVYSGKTYLYDLTNQTLIWNYTDNSRNLWSNYALSDDGQFIAKCDRDSGYITLFNDSSSNPLWQYQTNDGCWGISISSDGSRILAESGGSPATYGTLYLWDSNNNTPLWTYDYPESQYVTGVELSYDGTKAYVGIQPSGVYYFYFPLSNANSSTMDSDGDDVGDNSVLFPDDPKESTDADGDGVGDNSDKCPNSSSDSDVDSDGCSPLEGVFSGFGSTTSIVIGSGLVALIALIALVVVKRVLNRDDEDDDEEDDDDDYGYSKSEPAEISSPMQPRNRTPASSWEGEFADDGYEWLEHPAGSEAWYWRDTETGEWIRH
jgi:hypothetical protein